MKHENEFELYGKYYTPDDIRNMTDEEMMDFLYTIWDDGYRLEENWFWKDGDDDDVS